jgi:hypothetical protein
MSRERAEAIVRDIGPDRWAQIDVDHIVSNAIDYPDRDFIAHDLWALGVGGDHPGCPYAGGEGDADYENACETCESRLLEIADSIIAALLADTDEGARSDLSTLRCINREELRRLHQRLDP